MENEVAELQVKSKMAVEEQHRLGTEKGALIETVKRLNREVSRLDAFKRSLLQHLHDDEEPAQLDHSVAAVDLSTDRLVADVLHSAMKATQHPQQSQSSGPPPGPSGGAHTTSSYLPRSGPSTSTQHLGRGGPAGYASSTPSQPVSHTSPRGPTSPRAYVTSTPQPSGSHHYGSSQGQSQTSGSSGQYVINGGQYTSSKATVEPRMEAKDFFRHARAQLSYEAFSQFLQAIKQHNAGLASRDDTLRSARLIFGPGATDLYDVFEGLLTRNGAGLSPPACTRLHVPMTSRLYSLASSSTGLVLKSPKCRLCLVSSTASGTSRCAPRSNSSAPSQEATSLLVSQQAAQLQLQQPANPQLLIEPSPPDLSRPQPSHEPSAHALSSPEEDQQPNLLAHGSPEPPLQQPSATVLSGPGQAMLPGPPALSKHEARKARRVFPSLIPPPALPAAQDQLAAVFSNGAVLIDKPLGWTSFDVVAKLRSALRSLGVKKAGARPAVQVGHSGTLDPMATGLLILGTGAGTRFCDEFTAMRKSYSGVMRLGEITPSYDAETPVSAQAPWQHLTGDDMHSFGQGYALAASYEQVQSAAEKFVGNLQQLPPMFSAVKVAGQRLYWAAREGLEVVRQPRAVQVFSLTVWREGEAAQDLHFHMHCSKGTYVRSVAHDLGQALGCGAHLTALRRETVGDFSVSVAWQLPDLIDQLAEAELRAVGQGQGTAKKLSMRAVQKLGHGLLPALTAWLVVLSCFDALLTLDAHARGSSRDMASPGQRV
ncbi:hypothetical protein QJQ45_025135 [Haematococcus lacustris]|nr:hypothetical protein QJQ45_025135 [Haematococcus lacustris]